LENKFSNSHLNSHGIQSLQQQEYHKSEKNIVNYDAPHYTTKTFRNEPETPMSVHQSHNPQVSRQIGFTPSVTMPVSIQSDFRYQENHSQSVHSISSQQKTHSNLPPFTQNGQI
jgi:hypothetical protein